MTKNERNPGDIVPLTLKSVLAIWLFFVSFLWTTPEIETEDLISLGVEVRGMEGRICWEKLFYV